MANIRNTTGHASRHWGHAVFDGIPKAVFATVAWHLANVASGDADLDGASLARFREELQALIDNEIIPPRQGRAAIRVLDAHPIAARQAA